MTEEVIAFDPTNSISKLDGPILVTGAGGFIGAALMK